MLIFLCIASIAYSDNSSRHLFPVELDEKYGYIDKTGQIVIAPKNIPAGILLTGMFDFLIISDTKDKNFLQ